MKPVDGMVADGEGGRIKEIKDVRGEKRVYQGS